MTEYRCCGLDADNRVKAVERVAYPNDDLARLRAAIILANCDYATVEAWDGDRLICRVSKPGDRRPADPPPPEQASKPAGA